MPFGFRKNGELRLDITDFHISVKKRKKQKEGDKDDGSLHPGLIFIRSKTENDFQKYINSVLDEQSCFFGNYIAKSNQEGYDLQNEHVATGEDTQCTLPHVFNSTENEIFIPLNQQYKNKCLNHTFTSNAEAGLYFLIYQICSLKHNSINHTDDNDRNLPRIRSNLVLDMEYHNIDGLGRKSFLTAGEMPLPRLFLFLSISYTVLTFIWIKNIVDIMMGRAGFLNGGDKPMVQAIHHLMSCLLVLKTCSVFFESVRYHFIRVHGHAELWSFTYYLFTFVKGAFLFTVLLLLGSGWSLFKPFLNRREKYIILIVLILQVIDNFAIWMLANETEGERFYEDWRAVLHLLDILCCVAILVPIVWQINALEEAEEGKDKDAGENDNDRESARTLARLHLFRSFYLMVIGYIYFTRVGVYMLASMLSYQHTWMRYCFHELGTMTFYVVIGMKFRPITEKVYEVLQGEEEDELDGLEMELEFEEIELANKR